MKAQSNFWPFSLSELIYNRNNQLLGGRDLGQLKKWTAWTEASASDVTGIVPFPLKFLFYIKTDIIFSFFSLNFPFLFKFAGAKESLRFSFFPPQYHYYLDLSVFSHRTSMQKRLEKWKSATKHSRTNHTQILWLVCFVWISTEFNLFL